MLTPGNAKLGQDLIWGFGLPSGGAACVGMTKTCRMVCYALRTEQYRPTAAVRYRTNLALAKTKGFARRVRAFLIAHHVRVVRVHTGGEFFAPKYVRKWVAIAERARRVRFFTYTRAWRVPAIRDELDRLAELPNVQLWFSADRETGLPASVPPRVRVAWLMTDDTEPPPTTAGIDLVFRVQRLRQVPLAAVNGVPICPAEAGLPGPKPTCDRCGLCWKPPGGLPAPTPPSRRLVSLSTLTP
jgi:hypothetical protein